MDDSSDDLFLIKRAFRQAGVHSPVKEVYDGKQAIDYLEGTGSFADRELYPLPCMIITDIKMPQVDGFMLLRWLREQPAFARVPRIVLSSSGEDTDRSRARELGACVYLVKPCGVQELVEIVRDLNANWIKKHCPTADPASAQPKKQEQQVTN